MEKIAIIGATGFVGSALVKEALGREYEVTAIVRHAEKLPRQKNLLPLTTDIMDTLSLADSLKGFETVISAYNPGWDNPEIYDDTLKGYRSIIEASVKAGVKRLLIVGGAGSLQVEPGVMLMDTGSIPDKILPGVKGLAEVYIAILPKETRIDWVYFSPAAQLIHGRRTGQYRIGRDEMLLDKRGRSMISVEDYAKAMLDEAEYPAHHRERFTIGYHEPYDE